MKAKLIPIGNSRGVRIPKALIKQCELGDEVELIHKDKTVIIQSLATVRVGWAQSFEGMHNNQDDELVGDVVKLERDDEDWKW